MESLAAVRARDAPPAMFHSAKLAWRRRWLRLLSVSCARSFASSLVALPTALHTLGGSLIWQTFLLNRVIFDR